MKEYLAKKYVFTVVFLITIYAVAILNFLFSFDALKENIEENIEEADMSNVQAMIDTSDKFLQGLDTTMNQNVNGKFKYLELYGLYNKILGKNEYNGFSVVKDNNGVLMYGNLWNFSLSSDIPTEEFAKRVYKMQQSQLEKGTKVFVVNMPVKSIAEYLDYDTGIPYQDYSNVADDYIYYCNTFNLKTIDMRNAMKMSGLSYEDMFFKTDHHWTPLAGFYGFKYLVDELKKDGIDLDADNFYTDINNYNIETYKNCWLGSIGIKTGVNYINEMESISIIVPKFETMFHYEYRYYSDNHVIEVDGPMDETLINRKHIYAQLENDLYSGSAYSTYLSGVCAYDHIVNNNNPDGPKVLFIRDSYTSVIAPYFATLCSEVDLIWNKSYEYSIEELINENDYDYIFIATWPENLEEDSFNFYKE